MWLPGLWDDTALDDAFVYGSTPLGHEIAHAFDNEGRRYDADGRQIDWWTARDDSTYRALAQILIDQHNVLTPPEAARGAGERWLREIIADLVGLRIQLDAFKQTDQYKRGARIDGFTPLQRFFLAYTYAHTGHETPEALAARLRTGAYAPDRERVNSIVVHIPEFYEAFGVKPGDRMYRPEQARAMIW